MSFNKVEYHNDMTTPQPGSRETVDFQSDPASATGHAVVDLPAPPEGVDIPAIPAGTAPTESVSLKVRDAPGSGQASKHKWVSDSGLVQLHKLVWHHGDTPAHPTAQAFDENDNPLPGHVEQV